MTTEPSLYHRLGGYDVLARIVDGFLARLHDDPVLTRFALSMNRERQKRNRQLTLDYLVRATGGPALYLGQDMRTAHRGLGITSEDWELASEHFSLAIGEPEQSPREASELRAVFKSARGDIVES